MVYKKEYSQREFAHIFLLWRVPFLWSSAPTGEHTRGADKSAWETNGSLPLSRATIGSLPSVQNYRTYIVFLSPMQKYEHPLLPTYFFVYSWLSELTYFRFVPVICWFYLQTEISVTLSIGPIYQTRIWHKVNFLSGVWQVWFQSFPSPRLVASPRLKNLVCPTIYP